MNERMDELWRQSWVKIHPDDPFHERFDENKFAELIVRECMKVSRGADGLDATHEAWYLIKEHFGVE